MKYHINTCTPEELKQLNTIASISNISVKNVITFLNAFDVDNTRYQLIWGWLHDPCVYLKFKGFKIFIKNLKVRSIEDWVDATGERIF